MYHPGKIIKILSPKDEKIISSDNTTQALVRMWDENVLTFLIDPSLTSEVKEDDTVLVEFSAQPNSHPKQTIIKILRGDNADITWKKYKEHYEKIKRSVIRKEEHMGYTG